ncbi:SMP-30/gluconolactonase/LRE family protein [Maricaulis sp.]|uniref:SMP-30/gluconolactonase/LRE family protein n=1 Tax=Maricaulis sp. TaxID=1486257 RepID=UPI003A90ED2E
MKTPLFATFGGIAALALVWILWPARLDPAFWDEPEAPALTGVLEPRGRLAQAVEIGRGLLDSAEDVALAADGSIYTGQHDGSLVRLWRHDGVWQVETIARLTHLPVLGLQWSADGRLIAAASDGIYAVNVATGATETLATQLAGRPLGFADDLDVGPDGTIYFTEASWKWANTADHPSYQYDMAENRPYGALAALDPVSGETRVLMDDLYFANGVAMAADGQSVFVLETYRFRLSRYWLDGPQAGSWEVVDDNLPGIPDGLMGDGAGRLYIAMDTQRVPLLRFLHRNPVLTRMITKLPDWVWLRAGTPQGFVLVMDEDGNYLDSFHDPDGRFGLIANVVPDGDGGLWIGSLTEDVIGYFTQPEMRAGADAATD